MSVPESSLLRITDSDSQFTMIEYAIQPIQFTSMKDIKMLFEKFRSLGLIKLDGDYFISADTDLDGLTQELLFSTDGKTYLKTEVCNLTKEQRAQLQIYFIKKKSDVDFELIKAEQVVKEENDYLVNHRLTLFFGKLYLKNISLDIGSNHHNLNGSFEDMLNFINPALESFLWVLCQNLITHVNEIENHELYEKNLDEFKEFFSSKINKIKEFSAYLEKLSQESSILAKVKNQDLSPDELSVVINNGTSAEIREIEIKKWQEMRSDKLYFDKIKLDYGMLGLGLLACFGLAGASAQVIGVAIYYGLTVYNLKKEEDFRKYQEKIPDMMQILTAQIPSMTYLTSVIANQLEQLELKVNVIDAEIKHSHLERIGSVTIEEVSSSKLQDIFNYSSSFIFERLGIKNVGTQPIITEVDDEKVDINLHENTAAPGHVSSVTFEEVEPFRPEIIRH